MKFLQFLTVTCISLVIVQSGSIEIKEKAFLERASAQLERLAPYRKSDRERSDTSKSLQPVKKEPEESKSPEQRVAFEIYQILPESLQKDIQRRVGQNQAIIDLLDDPKYIALIQERIKRSESVYNGYGHDGYEDSGYGGGGYEGGGHDGTDSGSGGIISGSGGIITGIASGIIGGVASASSGASKGSSSGSSSSSESHKPEHGHSYSYDDKTFDVWDFKKAIINTLIQAIKAISGGVIALKGQLIKGSGFLVSTKGRIITTTGEAISSLGRHIASSAILTPPKHSSHPGYSYDAPIESVGHDHSYDGPPPSVDEYAGPTNEYHGNAHYPSSSDDDDHAGLLIVKPTKPDIHDDHLVDVDPRKPHLTQPGDSFDGPENGSNDKDVENVIHGSLDSYQSLNDGNNVESQYNFDHPPPTYSQSHYSSNDNKNGLTYPNYPPLNSDTPAILPSGIGAPVSIQQSIEYPPVHVEQIRYSLPTKNLGLDLPKDTTSNNDLSVYSSFSIGLNPSLDSIKISPLKHGDHFELPKLPHINFHGMPSFQSAHANVASQEPLKIPILSPLPAHYWQNQGLLHPMTSFGMHGLHRRKSNPQRRRFVSDVARHPSMSKNTRLHRVK